MIAIVLPTRNEAAIIRGNLERLLVFLKTNVNGEWRVVVADNGSTDATRGIVREVARRESRVELLELSEAGKGRAVLAAWTHRSSTPSRSPSARGAEGEKIKNGFPTSLGEGGRGGVGDVSIFMDADLATDLKHLPELVAAIRNGADIAVGSRLAHGAVVQRGTLRGIVSRANQLALRLLFRLQVRDAPCGFKAVSERVVREIVPKVRDAQWFFDTELLIRAQRANYRIVEIPVEWREPRRGGSLRKVLRIMVSDLRAMWRLWRSPS